MANSFTEQLIQEHAHTVRMMALRLASRLPSNIEVDDLIQAGMMGLIDAARRYKNQVGAQFRTYAVTRINGAMYDELRAQDWLPRQIRTAGKRLSQAIQELNNNLGREPNDQEIADHLSISMDEYHTLLDDAKGIQVLHYENLKGDDDEDSDDSYFLETIASEDKGPEELSSEAQIKRLVAEKISHLNEREQMVLSLYYEQDLNYKEVGLAMDITQGRVSQIHTKAIASIRAMLDEEKAKARKKVSA